MSRHKIEDEDGPALILDDELRLLRSIDPHICSVVLKSKTNNPSDHYDLSISAFFGSEYIRIQIAEEVVDFLFMIHKAEIVLDRAACKIDQSFERQSIPTFAPDNSIQSDAWSTTIKASTGKSFEEFGLPSASVEHSRRSADPRQNTEPKYNISFVREDTLSVSVSDNKAYPLKGMIIDDYVGWRIIPDPEVKSGVLARVRVREDWINLINPKNVGLSGKYWKKILDLVGNKSEEKSFRQKAFDILLRFLVAKGFQQASNTLDATIAMDSVIVRPQQSRTERIEGSPQIRRLFIDDNPLVRFLTSNTGQERQILLDAGVSPSKIPAGPEGRRADAQEVGPDANFHAEWSRSKELLTILIAQNDESLNLLLRYNLENERYDVIEAETADEILLKSIEKHPNIIVLEAVLKGGRSGFEICRRLRAQRATKDIPVVILTSRGAENDRVRGLEVGADDYIVKPFSVPELLARLRAVLRRTAPRHIGNSLRVGDITLDRVAMKVTRRGREIRLKKTEFLVLEFFMMNPSLLLSREDIMDGVWGNDHIVEERRIDIYINRLRRALSTEKSDDPIRTIRGSGYLLIGDYDK